MTTETDEINNEIKRAVILFSEFLEEEDKERWRDFQCLNRHEKTLALTLLIKEFIPDNNELEELYKKQDYIQFKLELVNDNEDCYDAETEYELLEELEQIEDDINYFHRIKDIQKNRCE